MSLSHLRQLVSRELRIFFGFTWRDWSTTMIPMPIFSVSAVRSTPETTFQSILVNYATLFVWLTLFIYFFNLSNQITGVDEDRINKPDRPIPSDLVSLEGAKTRWVISLAAFFSICFLRPELFPETLAWVINTGLLCLTGFGGHWFGRNMVGMGVGTFALMSGTWKAIAPITPESQRHILAVALWFGITLQIQDLRDEIGDAAVGRKTLPLVLGSRMARAVIAIFVIPASLLALGVGRVLSMAPKTLTAMHIYLCYRVMCERGARYDHKTYMLLTYIFCFILALIATQGYY